MWDFLDKLEAKMLKRYTTIDLEAKIEELYKTYSLDTKIASKTNVKRFKGIVQKNYKNLNDYGKYWANKLLKRNKIQNNEIVQFLIYIAYNEKQNDIDEYESLIVEQLVKDTYESEIAKIKKEVPKIKLPNPPLYSLYALSLLNLSNASGYVWKEYKDAMIMYNANEMYRSLLINEDKGIRDLLKAQKGRYLKKKIKPNKKDQYTGTLEDELVFVANKTKIKAYEDAGIKKVKFIAVIDDRTTIACQTMNEQEFWINKMNVYDRYDFYDKKNVVYHTFGLKINENLPPLHKNCRSTISFII